MFREIVGGIFTWRRFHLRSIHLSIPLTHSLTLPHPLLSPLHSFSGAHSYTAFLPSSSIYSPTSFFHRPSSPSILIASFTPSSSLHSFLHFLVHFLIHFRSILFLLFILFVSSYLPAFSQHLSLLQLPCTPSKTSFFPFSFSSYFISVPFFLICSLYSSPVISEHPHSILHSFTFFLTLLPTLRSSLPLLLPLPPFLFYPSSSVYSLHLISSPSIHTASIFSLTDSFLLNLIFISLS